MTFLALQELTAADLNVAFAAVDADIDAVEADIDALDLRIGLFARKSADETVTSSISLQDDNHLTLTLVANTVYTMRMVMWIGGDDAADLRLNFTIPTGTVGWMGQLALLGPTGASTASDMNAVAFAVSGTALSSDLSIGIADTNFVTACVEGLMEVGGTGGAFTARWAQVSSTGTGTVLKRGSFLRAQKVP